MKWPSKNALEIENLRIFFIIIIYKNHPMYHDERYNIDRIYNKVWNKKTVLNSKIKAFCLLGYFTTNKPLIYEELDTKY